MKKMPSKLISILIAFVAFSAAAPASAQLEVPQTAYGEGAVYEDDARVEARLIIDAEKVAPGGTVTVGVAFTLDPGWHIYAEDPGDAGEATRVEWQSRALEFGPLQWPPPEQFLQADGALSINGYEDEVVLFSKATIAEDAAGEIEVRADVEYLACNNMCLPGKSILSRTIPVAAESSPAPDAVVELFDANEAQVQAAAVSSGSGGDDDTMSLPWVLMLAFLGGMVLNLMPCVFPVLALKVSSFTKLVHEDKRSIFSHGVAYTGGIVASLLVLGGVVIGLRAAGTQVGWGFQFQQPHFLATLVVILVLFSLNLFGVYEVTLNSQKVHEKAQQSDGVSKSFWEGILAVVLATPCSAPFLGTAVGFALASSPSTILAVFAALGLGLAAPMVALTLVPGWAELLPKPGNWMAHLKKFLGFALLGSAIWIIWLLGRQTGVDGMAMILVFSAVLGVAAWIWGLVQFQSWSPRKLLGVATALTAIGVGGTYTFPLEARASSEPTRVASGKIDWQPWTEEAVAAELAAGRPVFVDFTADWCLTCKVNEKNAIDTEPVREAVAKYDVAMFKADWTNPNERIRKKLAEYGTAGVPFYLMYSPSRPERARPLPEVITSKMLVEAFSQATP